MGGIAFSLIWGDDTQTLGCFQNSLRPPLPKGKAAFHAYGVAWCGKHPLCRMVARCTPWPECHDWAWGYHGFWGPTRAGDRTGLGLWAGLRPRMGLTGAVSLLRRPPVRVLLATELQARAPVPSTLCVPEPISTVGLKSLEEVVGQEMGAPYTCQLIPETGQIVLTPKTESTSLAPTKERPYGTRPFVRYGASGHYTYRGRRPNTSHRI